MLQAEVRIPPVATVLPGQIAGEGGEEVEEDVGDDHVIIDGHQAHDEQHGRAGTWHGGQALPLGQPFLWARLCLFCEAIPFWRFRSATTLPPPGPDHPEDHRGLTFEEGADFPDGQGPQTGELAQREFEKEEGDATDGQHEEVGHEEGTCEEEGGWAGSRWIGPH